MAEEDNEILDVGLLEDIAEVVAVAIVSDDEDGDNHRHRVFVDIEGIRRLEDTSFRKHFRMGRHVFEALILTVGNHLRARDRLQRIRTPLDIALLMTLWMLFNADTFRSCAFQFGVSEVVVYFHYSYLIEAIRELAPRFIKWPSAVERDAMKVRFEEQYGYPGVVGCIDGTHINITAPLEQPQRYVNRHHSYSILMQCVCDDKLLYRDFYFGQPGGVGDVRSFTRSPLSDNLLTRPELISNDEHLLGDSAYPLTKHILVPYIDDGHLTFRQRRHKYLLPRARSAVERSFARLKGLFRRLKMFANYNLNIAMDHIAASVVLHNFIILEGNEADGVFQDGQHIHVHAGAPNEGLMRAAREEGMFKREYIAELFDQEN